MKNISLPIAFKSLARNKARTALTVLGIIIGITAVVLVLSAGQALESLVIGQVEAFGSNYLEVEIKAPQAEQASTENVFNLAGGVAITTLNEDDAKEIQKHPNIGEYYAGILGQEVVTYQSELKKALLFGVNAAFTVIDNGNIEKGQFFSDEDDRSLAKVVVLGSTIADTLFATADPIGKTIKVGRENYKVIGVMEERGASFGFDMDNMVFLPIKTLQKKILGVDYVTFIFAQLIDPSLHEQTVNDITFVMRDQHNITDPKKDDFAVTSSAQAQDLLGTVIFGIQALLIVLASISLIVGGVGIMNIMYVSVTERTYEIGLRKAIGAKTGDILWQFIWESIILTLFGAIIGVFLGISLSWLISVGAQSQGFEWDFSISILGIALALGMSLTVGLVFGLYPAKKAAALQPITALRKN